MQKAGQMQYTVQRNAKTQSGDQCMKTLSKQRLKAASLACSRLNWLSLGESPATHTTERMAIHLMKDV
jgi:hypothetical protein